MDGTYNNPYAQGQSQSPQTPGGYQVNVNRTKTRKWVQAPTQNYDGDDWGADEFEDDEPPPPPPVPRVTTGLRPVGQRTESFGPSPRLAAAVASSSRSSSNAPSLQLQTNHPDVANPDHSEQTHNVSSPGAGRTGSPAPLSSGAGSSRAPSYHQQPDVRSSTPQSTASSAARASPSIRPDFRHIDDERKLGGSPLSIAENIAPRPDDRSTPPVNEPNRQGHGQGDGPAIDKVQKQPTFDSILAKRDSIGLGPSLHDPPALDNASAASEPVSHKEETVIHPPTDIDRKRLSVSPQLPDVARMSVFGADFFSSGTSSGAPASAQDPIKQDLPSASKQATDGHRGLSTLEEKPREGEDNSSTPGPNKTTLAPANDPRAVPPLRTPSPNSKGLFPSTREPASATDSKITPTEPLNPRQPEYSPSNYEPNSALTQGSLNTFNSSPVKESDVLSEEIMRSLSPIAPTSNPAVSRPLADNSQSLTPGDRGVTRNSSYTLSDYDSYWADSNEKHEPESKEADVQEKPKTETPLQEQPTVQPLSSATTPTEFQVAPQAPTKPESPKPDSRRRFSWEAGFDSPPKIFPVEPAAGTFDKEAPRPASPSPLAPAEVQSPKDESADASQSKESTRNVDTPKIVIPPSGGISHQVSKASTLPPSQQQGTLEPPSPVSIEHDDATPRAVEDRRPSVADKTLTQVPSNLTSASPPRPDKSTKAIPSSQFPQTTPWHDIMTLATPVQRTLKFEAGLAAHQAWESGLENWLSDLMTEHPEYANGTSSFSGSGVPTSQKGHASGPSLSHNQQPYYQQYLNASSPTTGPPTGRSRLGGSAPSGTSGFGNSSNQIGTKGKELMQSAGKMGKGLFSKGKSKLRGTGDKGEPTSPVQTKFKAERRASWGLDRLTRSRADDSSEKDVVNSRPSTQSYHAPQSSQSSSMLQFGYVPSTGEPGKRIASRESYGPQLSQDPSASASASASISALPSKENDDRTQWYIPTPIDESTWDPFKGTDLAKDKASDQSEAMPASQGQPQDGSSTQMPSSKPMSGNPTLSPASGGIRMVPREESGDPSPQPASVHTSVISQEPMANAPKPQTPTQAHNPSDMPQRHSSFVGLPPIRRGSTFDVNSRSTTTEERTTEPIAEHVTAEPEDFDEIARQQGTLTSEVTVGSTLVGTDSIMEEKYKKDIDGSEPQSPFSQKSPRHSLQQSPPRGPQHPFQMHPVQPGPMVSQSQGYRPPTLPLLPPQLMGGPVQRLPPSGPWKLEESHLSEPLHRVTPKPQAVPPSGQWKLEESHLAEPLHMVNRNRAGTNASQISQLSQRSQRSQKSQHDPFFGYNKETGEVPPSPSSSSTVPKHHQRQKPSEVPPSSANRYPGLFHGHQRQSSGSKEGHPGPGSQFIRRFSQEGITRTGTGESANEDRGRSKKASALLKDIGHRFRKSSTERHNTPVDRHGQQFHPPAQQQQDLQPPHGEVHHDAASVSSVTTDGTHDKKKSRASFMLGLRSKQSRERLSMPPPPRPDENRPATSTEERRGSRLNPDFDPTSGQLRPMGPPRAATSNLANEMSQAATPPAKKRFSAFNTKAAMTNVFNRPSSGASSKPGTPTSSRPMSGHMAAQQPMSLERPAHPGFERSSTAGPTFNQILPTPSGTPPVDANERRKRRGSAAGLISGLLGHVHKSKESQQNAPPQTQLPIAQQPYDRRASSSRLDSPHPPALQTQGRRPSGPPLTSPGLPGSPLGSPHGSVPPLASPQPQRPHQLGQQAMSREQSPMSSARPLSGGMRDSQYAQAAYRNSRPSPLGFGSTTPAGTPPVGSVIDHSRHGTPQTPFSVGQSFPDPRAARMRSISPAASAIRSAPTTQTSFNVPSTAPTTQPSFHHSSQSSQSLDKLAHSKQEGTQIQRPVTDSPNMSFRHDNRPSLGASDNDTPLSPVSQMSNMGPPSVSSMATQSPRLNTTSAAVGRRQSSQLSQPGTPVVSAVSTTPPVQTFANRMGMSPQQQQPQQLAPGFQQQPASAQQTTPQQMHPNHSGYQIAPGQQYEPNLRQPSGSQPMPGSYPQATSPGRSPMQMQHSDSGPPVPPKDALAHLQQPQVANQPTRQGSPGASKWKGLRNRMSAQVSHKPAASQGKNENDKLTASKILGAFKRNSKDNRQSMVVPDLQAYQNHEMRPVQRQQQPQRPQQPQISQQPQQQFAGQVPPAQTQSPRPSSQVSGQPFGQAPTARPSSQSTGQPQTKRYSSMFSSPVMPQQDSRSPSGAYASSPQGMGHPQPGHPYQSPPQMQGRFPPAHSPQAQFHSPPQPHGQFQSPVQQQGHFQSPPQAQGQFTSPPMPQGQFRSPLQQQGHFQSPVQQQGQFQPPTQPHGQWQPHMHLPAGQFPPPQQRQASYPGQWHGTIGQSPNTPSSHRSPQHSQFSSQPQSPYGFPTGHNVPGEESPPVHVSTPTQVHSPTPVHAPSPRPSLLNLQAMVAANTEHDQAQEEQHERTQAAPRNDPNPSHQGDTNMQRFKSDSPHSGSNPSPAQHTSPRIGTEQNGHSKTQAPTLPMPSIGGSSFMGSPVTTNANTHFSPKVDEPQGVSLSPPSGAPGSVSPNSMRQSPADGSDLGPPEPKSRGGPSFHAELEDTEDARKRTLRIDSQEEKIHYDPNADSDGELPPQMSATSYPGQEWNPYGMPEMGDWNEPMDHR
ncbi:hypothetical protein FBEOM_3521 [Fusarium beomiforme]|uniref:Uncharacterized protein n=1 Tax=Fusarium beomiforme TaxID=44412 RepID=A0A9P5APL3_9HYPO|nr:hypothetical protein FBEOM_3521 [Fusarium beomiforme]